MRIRKNARLITSSSSSPFLVCQLNRSPWDVDSFSLQGEVEDDIGVNGNLASSNSLHSVESMELSFEYVEKTVPPPQSQLPILDDRNRCKPPLKEGPPLPPIPTAPKKRGRPKKSTSTATTTTTTTTTNNSSNNPYEFYYYSGFGPSWGKRRGNKCTSSIIVGNETNSINNFYKAIINDVNGSPSSASHVMCEDDDKDDGDNKNIIINNNNNNNDNNVIVIDRIVEGELDYIEDDFDDDDEDENLGGRRVRKPVKARSLKSLM